MADPNQKLSWRLLETNEAETEIYHGDRCIARVRVLKTDGVYSCRIFISGLCLGTGKGRTADRAMRLALEDLKTVAEAVERWEPGTIVQNNNPRGHALGGYHDSSAAGGPHPEVIASQSYEQESNLPSA